MDVKELAEKYNDFNVAMRRELHQHPELSSQEFETTAKIITQLEGLNIEYIRPTNTGVIAIIHGAKKGKTIALRCDIDALPVTETNAVDYKSKTDGVMHACGHDGHTSSLLTAAKILNDLKSTFCGTVKLIFQPAEEYFPSGAKAMVASGSLNDVDGVFAIHIKSDIPVGKVSVEAGARMAASAGIDIKISGNGGHGGNPHQCVDATLAAASVLVNLQSLVSRELDVNNSAVISIGTFHSGSAKNIISAEAVMSGTCRYYDTQLFDTLNEAITRIAKNTAASFRAQAEVKITPGSLAVINDKKMSECAKNTVTKLWGESSLIDFPKSSLSEDFSNYLKIAPCEYALVGAMGDDSSTANPHHNANFNIDERCLKISAELYAQFALDFLSV